MNMRLLVNLKSSQELNCPINWKIANSEWVTYFASAFLGYRDSFGAKNNINYGGPRKLGHSLGFKKTKSVLKIRIILLKYLTY